jgi:membrane protein DedA with SNARE-associated domain
MFLVTLGERLGLPVFISPLLLAAGAMVAVNPLQFWLVLFATAVPCLLGDAMWYELGRWRGRKVIAAMCRISFVPDSLEQKAYAGLDRFKGTSLLYAKWIPGVAHLAPPVAGAARLPRLRFHLYNGIGSLVWILVMLLAGVVSMRTFDWMEVFTRSSKWSIGFIATGTILMGGYSWWRRKQSKALRAAAEAAAGQPSATDLQLSPRD